MRKLPDLKEHLQGRLKEARAAYAYQPALTQKLDGHEGDFTEMTLLEIVLWKVNRYPEYDRSLLDSINDLRTSYSEEKASVLLRRLLDLRGFDLPMASTLLRFACPDHLAIIDQRVYRFITPGENVLKMPHNKDKRVALYFEYLERLRQVCISFGIPFREADRLLYQLDKMENKDERIQVYGKE